MFTISLRKGHRSMPRSASSSFADQLLQQVCGELRNRFLCFQGEQAGDDDVLGARIPAALHALGDHLLDLRRELNRDVEQVLGMGLYSASRRKPYSADVSSRQTSDISR